MTKRRRFLAAFALGLAFVTVGGCGKAPASKVINVAVTPASPPNLFEENGQTKGLDYDLFDGYCKARGCTMNITAYDFQGMLGAVVSRKADVAFSGISITEPRKQVMDFSKPYMDNDWDLVSMKSRNLKLANLDTLKNYTIGFPRGAAYMDFIKTKLEPKGIYSTDKAKLYPSYNEALTDLQNGQVDLVFQPAAWFQQPRVDRCLDALHLVVVECMRDARRIQPGAGLLHGVAGLDAVDDDGHARHSHSIVPGGFEVMS